MTPLELELALGLVKTIRDSVMQLKRIKDDSPEVYAAIEAHGDKALADAKAALDV